MTDATLAAGASCVLSFDVLTTAGGPWTFTYTITLTNIGGSTSGLSARVKDALPAGVTVAGVTPGSYHDGPNIHISAHQARSPR